MIYEYECCGNIFEVIKRVSEIDNVEECPVCSNPARRIISRNSFYGADDWDSAEFCPGLGQVVKSNKHRQKIARSRGLEEVGTQDMEKVSKTLDSDRRREEKNRIEEACKDAYNYGFN